MQREEKSRTRYNLQAQNIAYAPNNTASKYIGKKWTELQDENTK